MPQRESERTESAELSEPRRQQSEPTAAGYFVRPTTLAGRVWLPGERVELTDELVQAATGADGRCIFAMSVAEQVHRWGEEIWRPGEPPEQGIAEPLVDLARLQSEASTRYLKSLWEAEDLAARQPHRSKSRTIRSG